MPIPKGIVTSTLKAGKMLKGALSSASKELEGTLYNGKTIKSVVKGRGDWRYIVTHDDAVEAVSKDIVNSLARSAGTSKQVTKFALANEESKLAQAYKSLKLHVVKAAPEMESVLDFHNSYTKQLTLTGAVKPKMSLVKSKEGFFTLPTDYAKLLIKDKAVKIIKDLK
jgi:hypothetical protein